MNRRTFLSVLPVAVLAGCGFQLRRVGGIPFASLYVDAPPGSAVASRVIAQLKTLRSTRLALSAAEADAILKLDREAVKKSILSLSGAGRVTEYRLSLEVIYSIIDPGQRALAPAETIELSRDITYDDSRVLAKSAEESLLYRDMEEDAARRIIRRLQAVKPGGDS